MEIGIDSFAAAIVGDAAGTAASNMEAITQLLIGGPEEIAEKIKRHSEALGGISRLTFQMDNAGLSHEKLLRAIELVGSRVKPLVNGY